MPDPSLDFDLLRSGILLEGRYKLMERIPRWVCQRRFRASTGDGKPVKQLLFFSLGAADFEVLKEWAEAMREVRHRSLYEVEDAGSFKGFRYLVGEDIFAPSLRDRLENEGEMPVEELQKMLGGLLGAVAALQGAGYPVPALLPETILIEPASVRPVLFPFPLPGYAPPDEDAVPGALRDLLYQMGTNRPAPREYGSEHLRLLPPPTRKAWAKILKSGVNFDDLESFSASQVELPPTRPLPPILPERDSLPARAAKAADDRDEFDEPSPANRRRRSPKSNASTAAAASSPASKLAAAAAVVAACFVAWFSWFVIGSMTPPKPAHPGQRNDPHGSVSPDASGFRQPDSRQPPPHQTAFGAPPDRQLAELAGVPPASGRGVPGSFVRPAGSPLAAAETAPENWLPQDKPGQPGSALAQWTQLWLTAPDQSQVAPHFERYLESLGAQEAAMRSGQLPDALAALERAHQAGFAPAGYLLAKVLWGRESQRSEKIMASVARAGHPGAQAWCDELFIEWKTPE